ncbi:MAG: hypothetical protein M5U08_24870 [Burkholderiales bacterium]|nr:hypothetical protein [Burkholderiales bacterium]
MAETWPGFALRPAAAAAAAAARTAAGAATAAAAAAHRGVHLLDERHHFAPRDLEAAVIALRAIMDDLVDHDFLVASANAAPLHLLLRVEVRAHQCFGIRFQVEAVLAGELEALRGGIVELRETRARARLVRAIRVEPACDAGDRDDVRGFALRQPEERGGRDERLDRVLLDVLRGIAPLAAEARGASSVCSIGSLKCDSGAIAPGACPCARRNVRNRAWRIAPQPRSALGCTGARRGRETLRSAARCGSDDVSCMLCRLSAALRSAMRAVPEHLSGKSVRRPAAAAARARSTGVARPRGPIGSGRRFRTCAAILDGLPPRCKASCGRPPGTPPARGSARTGRLTWIKPAPARARDDRAMASPGRRSQRRASE